ncbi:hypothetical protein PTKIN_Ptkin10aG0198500 [Pterospermum kingtungense]
MEPIISAKTAKETLAAFQDMEASLDDTDLGLASLKVASQLHQEGKDPEQALSLAHKALKALDQDGKPSIPVSLALHLIGCVNLNLERFDDSLEYLNRAERLLGRLEKEGLASIEAVQDELANVNTDLGRIDEALDSEMDAAEMQISLGKFDEAINTLQGIVRRAKNVKHSENQAFMFILIGEDLCDQGKFADSMGCLEFACKILDKKEAVYPRFVAKACIDVANVYDAVNEFETAVSFLKRALALIEKELQEQHGEGTVSARIGSMLLLRGDVPQAIPYFGECSREIQRDLSLQAFRGGLQQSGCSIFGIRKTSVSGADVCSGKRQLCCLSWSSSPRFNYNLPESFYTIRCNGKVRCYAWFVGLFSVSVAFTSLLQLHCKYAYVRLHTLSIGLQQQVIDAWNRHGPRAIDERIVHDILEHKRKTRGTSPYWLPTKAMPLPGKGYASRLPDSSAM